MADRDWVSQGIGAQAFAARADGLPAAEVWSLLLEAFARRASTRTPADVRQQYARDGFTQPAPVDQRTLVELDGHLLAAAHEFEAIELAPLAACSAVARTSQKRVVRRHITTYLAALDRLEANGSAFPNRRLSVLTTPARTEVADRIAASISGVPVSRGELIHEYYDGLRFQIAVGDRDGGIPLIDGGAFDWLSTLTSNRKMAYVASGMGSQLAAFAFRYTFDHHREVNG
jgi:hypothetical protein